MPITIGQATDLADLVNWTRILWRGQVYDQKSQHHVLKNWLRRDTMVGPDVRATATASMAARARFQSHEGHLPDPHRNAYFVWTEDSFNAYSSFAINDKTLELFNRRNAQIVDQLTDDISGARRSVENLLQWSCYGDGTGTITTTTQAQTGASGSTVTVDSTWRLDIGQQIDFIRVGQTTPFSASETKAVITDISDKTSTITVTSGDAGAFAIQEGDRIVNTGSYGQHFHGITAICDETVAIQGVGVTDQRVWVPGWDEDLGAEYSGELSQDKIIQVLNHLMYRYGSVVDAIFTTPDIQRLMIDAWRLKTERVNNFDKSFGWDALEFRNGNRVIPIFVDSDCPRDTMFFLEHESLVLNELTEGIKLIDVAGGMQQIAGYAAYTGGFAWYGNITTTKRNSNGRLTGIQTVKPIGQL